MFLSQSFKLSTPSDYEIQVTRDFDAPIALVFDAFTKPEFVRRWLLGPPGWTMPVCEIDLRVGGAYRYIWHCEADGSKMGIGGVFREIILGERLVVSEKFDEAWYPGEATVTTVFAETMASQRPRSWSGTNREKRVTWHDVPAWNTAWPQVTTGSKHCYRPFRRTHVIEAPQIVDAPAQLTATVHITTPRSEMQHVMGPGIGEAMTAAQTQGVGPAGPWFTHHTNTTEETFDFDICVPVSAPVAAVGRVKPGQRPAVKVVRTIYHGPYEGLGDAWHDFSAWVEANGHRTADDFYECYLVGPESSADPADWRTELSWPLM